MKKLFLTSRLSGSKDILAHFLAPMENKQLLFIPTASLTQKKTQYVTNAREIFKSLGFNVIDFDISKLDQGTALNALAQCQLLYVSGGNTFYLLQELKRLDLIPYIRKRVAEGMIYIGESAGAIVAAQDIEYVQGMDDKRKGMALKEYTGLALVDFCIVPHYKETPFVEEADAIMAEYADALKLVPINNKEAIIVCEEAFKIVNNEEPLFQLDC